MTTLSRPVTLQGHHLPSAVIRHPQSVSALLTALPKRRQGGGELRFGSRGSSRHRFAPVAKKPASSPQRTPGVKEGFPFSQKTGMSQRCIKRDRGVALAQDKAVTLRIVGLAGVDAQHGE